MSEQQIPQFLEPTAIFLKSYTRCSYNIARMHVIHIKIRDYDFRGPYLIANNWGLTSRV